MFSPKIRLRLSTFAAYAAVGLIALTVSASVMRAAGEDQDQAATPEAAKSAIKPFFQLSTNHTYGTADKGRVWITYEAIDHLDFRVYRVNDPVAFFEQLNDPHQMGQRDKNEVASAYQEKPSALEKVRSFKVSIFKSIKNYLRRQLDRNTRETFVQKFHGEDRLPLNVADYARVPLLNPNQLVGSWREMLPAPQDTSDTRFVTLGKRDPGVYLVEAVNQDLRAYTIAIVTDITLVTKTAPGGGLLVYAVDRKSGKPRPDAQITAAKGGRTLLKGATDGSGLFRSKIPLDKKAPQPVEAEAENAPDSQVGQNSYLVMAASKDNFAISDLQPYYFRAPDAGEGDADGDTGGGLVGYVYSDRPIYRPAQTVYFKGILRTIGENGYEMPGDRTVSVTVSDPNGTKIFDKDLALSARGAFAGQVDIAAGAPLGSYEIKATAGLAGSSTGSFEVQEYKKPEYKVTVTTPKQFVPVGEKTTFSVQAKYFFGSPVTKADVQYYIYRSRYYSWWWADENSDDLGDNAQSDDSDETGDYGFGNDMVKDGNGVLDDNGNLNVEFEVPKSEANDPYDYSYRLEAQVTDSARRTIDGKASFIGVRGNVVAELNSDRYVYYQGDKAQIRVSTATYQGKPLSTPVSLKFIRRTWEKIDKGGDDKYNRYEYKLHETEVSSAEVTTNEQGQITYSYLVPAVGDFIVKSIVHDGSKQYLSGTQWLWVADRNNQWADFSFEDNSQVKLVPDKKSYQPGETAHVLAMLPDDGAHLLVTTELQSVMTARTIDAPGRAVMIDVPIEARYSPNMFVSVVFVKNGDIYQQDKSISVPAKSKFLKIDITTDKNEYKPRDKAAYTVIARNQDGSPAAGAELSLGVVDEAIYSIRPDTAGDIRRGFYGHRYNQVQTQFSVSYSFSGYSGDKPINLAGLSKKAYELADFKNDNQYVDTSIRTDFKDTAFWQPDLITGADGKATVSFDLPDNLTTWRATVRGVTADLKVGSGVAKVIARKNLIMRLEAPRFLTKGDTAVISGIVHNYLNSDKSVKISIDIAGATLMDAASQTVTIPKQGEKRIDWRVSAAQVGDVTLLGKALTDEESDAMQTQISIVPAGLQQTSGGVMAIPDDSADRTVSLDVPGDADPMARTLRVEVTPSIAGSLFGALDYLTSYPYGCTEQTMSSFLPNVVVAQALKEVKTASLKTGNDLTSKVQRGLDRLYAYQHGDGGWGWWRDDKTDPFMTAYVVDGLSLANQAGYPVDSGKLEQGRASLKQMLSSGKNGGGKQIDLESRAYMVYALKLSGDADSSFVNDLFNKRGELQPYGRALLALSLKLYGQGSRSGEVASEIENSGENAGGFVHWKSSRRPMLDFTEDDSLEATALSLKALSNIKPTSGLLPGAARWLVANRRYGYYWDSTRQTAFAVFALIDYLKVSKELSPDYTVDVYINGQQVATHKMTAADAASGATIAQVRQGSAVGSSNQVRIVKHGAGMLYATTSLTYFSNGDNVAPQSSSALTLTREYLRLRVSEGENKPEWTIEPLQGDIRSGDMIVVRLRLKGDKSRFLMIEDPIPAGCEQIDQVSGINLDYTNGKWSDWYSNREFRDNKTVLFVDYFSGSDTFQYAMRVQEPGQFRAAPARATLMYSPWVQSNTAEARMNILDKQQ